MSDIDLGTMYLTSISTGGSVPLTAGQPWVGALLTLVPGVKGSPSRSSPAEEAS